MIRQCLFILPCMLPFRADSRLGHKIRPHLLVASISPDSLSVVGAFGSKVPRDDHHHRNQRAACLRRIPVDWICYIPPSPILRSISGRSAVDISSARNDMQ